MRPALVILTIYIGSACASLPTREEGGDQDLIELAGVLAQHFDEPNGKPIEVWAHYWCPRGHTCLDVNSVQFSPVSAEVFVGAFAQALGIRVVAPDRPAARPKCDWSGVEAEATGLVLRFYPPEIVQDSARFVTTASCDASPRGVGGFSQSHEYIFRRASQGWALVLRRLLAIT